MKGLLCRPVSPLSDGGIGGSDGEGIHSPSRKKKRKYEEESSSKKDSFDQVFVCSTAHIAQELLVTMTIEISC